MIMIVFDGEEMSKRVEMLSEKFIVKSNALIEARYRLNRQESQVIFWLLTQINSADEDFRMHKLDISEFSKLAGVTPGNKYSGLRKITKDLMRRVVEIFELEDQEIIQISWFSSARYQLKKGCVLLELSPQLKPYLLQLKSCFTKIDITDVFKLKSTYSIRIFELLLQYQSLGKRKMSVEEIRLYCGVEKHEYKDYFGLKCKIIEKAKTEINEKTEYNVDYTEIKESRKVVAVEWSIKKKNVAIDSLRLSAPLSTLMERLTEYGFSKPLAARIVKNHEEAVIRNALEAVDIQVSKGNVKNAKAMLQIALKEAWKP